MRKFTPVLEWNKGKEETERKRVETMSKNGELGGPFEDNCRRETWIWWM